MLEFTERQADGLLSAGIVFAHILYFGAEFSVGAVIQRLDLIFVTIKANALVEIGVIWVVGALTTSFTGVGRTTTLAHFAVLTAPVVLTSACVSEWKR